MTIVGWMTLLYNFYRWDDIKRIYADAIDGNVYHYRDANGLECDAIVHLRNGSYGLIEIKLITVSITLNSPSNTCAMLAQQLLDMCTSAVMRAHNS